MKGRCTILVIPLCLVLSSPLSFASEQGGDGRAPPAAAADKAGGQNGEPSGESKKPVETFKPTERIRADSAVSFPVDI